MGKAASGPIDGSPGDCDGFAVPDQIEIGASA
jgi:hypothetical protein